MDSKQLLRDFGPLISELESIIAGVRAISQYPLTTWEELGPVKWVVPPDEAMITCALCGMPVVDPYRLATDGCGRAAHYNRQECLEMLKNIAVFVLETYIGTEPRLENKLGLEDDQDIPF